MKIKDGYILRKIAGDNIVIPVGNNIADFNGVIRLNESATLLWSNLQQETTEENLINLLVKEYEIDEKLAANDVREFINILKEKEIFEGN